MKTILPRQLRNVLLGTALVASGALIGPPTVKAQAIDSSKHTTSGQDPQLSKQVQELQAQVERLQAALDAQQAAPSSGQPQSPMGMGDMDKMEMGGMSAGGMGMMEMEGEMGMPPEGMEMPQGMMMDDDMGMGGGMPATSGKKPAGMSGTAGTGGMSPGGGMNMGGGAGSGASKAAKAPKSMSSLPGVPGASHLYHIGSTGFFLDQPQISLSSAQRSALARIKERALLDRGNAERRIEQAEQELWVLTGADRPDASKIEAKAREIERLRTSQRMAFIQAVGEATKQLTADQRSRLLGTGVPATK